MPRPHQVDYLQPKEKVVAQARRHPVSAVDEWIALVLLYGLTGAAVAFVTLRFVPATYQDLGHGVLAVLGLLWLVGMVIVHWRRVTSLYTVTPERVYKAYGRIRFHLLQTTYDKVTDLHLYQSLFGRIWGYGTVRVQTAGTGVDFVGVRDPVAFKQTIETQRSAFLRKLVTDSRSRASAAGGAPKQVRSVADATTLWRGRPVLPSFLAPALFAVLVLLVGMLLLAAWAFASQPTLLPAGFLLLFAVLTLSNRFIAYRFTAFEVTSEGTVLTRGWLSRRRVETTFAKVTDVSVDQDIVARIFGYGRITINTAGSNEAPVVFQGLGDPDAVKAIIDRARREVGRGG